jgi:hypothetical protein
MGQGAAFASRSGLDDGDLRGPAWVDLLETGVCRDGRVRASGRSDRARLSFFARPGGRGDSLRPVAVLVVELSGSGDGRSWVSSPCWRPITAGPGGWSFGQNAGSSTKATSGCASSTRSASLARSASSSLWCSSPFDVRVAGRRGRVQAMIRSLALIFALAATAAHADPAQVDGVVLQERSGTWTVGRSRSPTVTRAGTITPMAGASRHLRARSLAPACCTIPTWKNSPLPGHLPAWRSHKTSPKSSCAPGRMSPDGPRVSAIQ